METTDILVGIRVEKEACCALFRKLNESLTVPSQDPKLNPTHKYSLRGVITSPDVLYMCTRRYNESRNNDNDGGDPDFDQWYRVSWLADGANAVQQTVRAYCIVIALVSILMIHSPDRKRHSRRSRKQCSKKSTRMAAEPQSSCMQPRTHLRNSRSSLPAHFRYGPTCFYFCRTLFHSLIALSFFILIPFQSFMKRDNRLFGQELKEEPPSSPRDRKRVAVRSPQSPPKRQRSDSADSMATNRASIGDYSDVEDRAALLGGQFDDVFGPDPTGDTEMADMRPISHDEIAAHLAPPTPALSADDASDQESPGLRRSSEKLANFSLNDVEASVQQGQAKTPEMEEQLKTPFIVRRPASALDTRTSIMERPMEIDANLEIPGVHPEEYYHQGS